MKAHIAYLRYVLRHKWFVLVECFRVGLFIQGIVHDWSKFTPVEWGPYVRSFYNSDGSKRSIRDASGAYDPTRVSDEFSRAWLSHQRNKHHWQAWCSIGDNGKLQAVDMPLRYRKEMICDWRGAGRAINGTDEAAQWYAKNRDKMILHPDVRAWVDSELGYDPQSA